MSEKKRGIGICTEKEGESGPTKGSTHLSVQVVKARGGNFSGRRLLLLGGIVLKGTSGDRNLVEGRRIGNGDVAGASGKPKRGGIFATGQKQNG